VTENLLNELNTLAAPSMLAAALQAIIGELGDAWPDKVTLFSYNAEFREGARQGDSVQIAGEETAGQQAGDRAFRVYFSKAANQPGRVGKWHLIFAAPHAVRLLPYDLNQPAVDGRTDQELWRSEPMVATGSVQEDAQTLLWLAGQSARGYMKRLDQEFADAAKEIVFHDDLRTRQYGGIAVTMTLAGWPAQGRVLRCSLLYQLPLLSQPKRDRKMDFHGVLVAQDHEATELLGTFRFTVVRLNGQRQAIYPDGSTERR
jgi:hypothetical protein